MKFEKEINFYDTPAIASKFVAQDTSLDAINGKISKIISDTELTHYDNGQNTMASALNAAISTANSNSQTLSTLQTNFNTKSGEFDTFKTDYNQQLQTTTQNISTVGSVAASKGKIFSAQPSIPYQVNDIWLRNGQNGSEIYRCITAKTDTANDVFSADDWVKATSYATTGELGSLSSTVSQIQQTANSVSLKVQASNNTHKLSDIVNGENYDLGDFVVSESGVKRVTVEPNRDGNGNAIYRSTDLSDVTNAIPTSAEISTAIEDGISNATIEADNIDFSGHSINLTSDNMEIRSTYFYVNMNGSVTCRDMKCDGVYIPFSQTGTDSISRYAMLDSYGVHVSNRTSKFNFGSDSTSISDGINVKAANAYNWVYDNYQHECIFRAQSNSRKYDYNTGTYTRAWAELYDNGIEFNTGDNYFQSLIVVDNLLCANYVKTDRLACSGSKQRIVKDTAYGDVAMYSYETATPLFGDVGEGVIGDDGQAYIYLDPKFLETIKNGTTYQVFLQSYSEYSVYVSERKPEYFIVKGTPGGKFAWEMKGRQDKLELEYQRLQEADTKNMLPTPKEYVTITDDYIKRLRKERVTI